MKRWARDVRFSLFAGLMYTRRCEPNPGDLTEKTRQSFFGFCKCRALLYIPYCICPRAINWILELTNTSILYRLRIYNPKITRSLCPGSSTGLYYVD